MNGIPVKLFHGAFI